MPEANFENPFKVPKFNDEELKQEICLRQTFSQLTNLHRQLETIRDGLLEERKTALENQIAALKEHKK